MENAKRRQHLETFVRAAEEAVKVEDFIGAANNYKLALQIDEDPSIRERLTGVEVHAKAGRREKALVRARAAEREQRWGDAAMHFSQAHDAVPEAPIAERAAHSIRMSNGDLRRAAALAEFAVSQDPKNAAYRVTLGEVYHAANLPKRAAAESAKALELAPSDARATQLAAAVKKMR
jgi:tetratricopeptide (TPR) repeat protein